MITSWPFGVLTSLLITHAWEDSHGFVNVELTENLQHGRLGRQSTGTDDPMDTIAIDSDGRTARLSVSGTHGRESRASDASSTDKPVGTIVIDDEAVLSEIGFSDADHKERKLTTPSLIRKAAPVPDSDHNNEGHKDSLRHQDPYELSHLWLKNEMDSGFLQGGGQTRQRRVDCSYSKWTDWSPCSLTCAGGTKQQKRQIVGPYHGGKACPFDYTLKEEACNSDPCPANLLDDPVDCSFTDWGDWGACSHICVTGQKTARGDRTRDRSMVGPFFGGKVCVGHTREDGACGTFSCPYDCVAEEWGPWSVCSQTCSISLVHHGYRKRERASTAASNGGKKCSDNLQMVHCNTQLCPFDCQWSEWGAWGPCSEACTDESTTATGTRIRVRDKVGPMGAGAKDCDGSATDTSVCDAPTCPIDCTFKDWKDWGACSKTCDSGTRIRKRDKNEAQFGGKDCEGRTINAEMCEGWACPVDCRWSLWDAWKPCSKSCDSGTTRRSRAYDPKPVNGGMACVGAHMEMNDCNDQPCPIDCMWEEWMDWSLCTTTCGKGKRSRIRLIEITSTHGGKECDHTSGAIHNQCPRQMDCPVDCHFSEWGAWDICNASCESEGHRNANRVLLQAEKGGLSVCPEGPLSMAQECTGEACDPAALLDDDDDDDVKNGAPRVQLVVTFLILLAPFRLFSL